ncbi:ATP-binding protein [uncultured Xylophilus sp.]|uniref:sensor histidine kinase n=1 Tax=uncultured Xylophilus sp. TaxID=296832 RepID=UPI0025F52688|nr:ATP-binding protein [uncultured Xylophilus sp.]
MPAALPTIDEEARLRSLIELGVLDSAPDPEFEALVQAASLVCDVPVSLVSLVDADRQWFKAALGLPGTTETPREDAFCAHAIHGDELLEVPDALADPRFTDNRLVLGGPEIRFYAGAPLRLSDGMRMGTLCVIDRVPRRLDERQRAVLQQLARAAALLLERRRDALAHAVGQATIQALNDAAPLGMFRTDDAGRMAYVNRHWTCIFGADPAGPVPADWTAAVAEKDRERVRTLWQAPDDPDAAPEIEFRVAAAGDARYVRLVWRAVRGEAGAVLGRTGFAEDVTERRRAADALVRMGERLAEQSRRKNHFLAALSHELRGPLSALHNGLHMMGLDPDASPRAERAVGMMRRQVDQMAALIDGLLDVSRIEAGKVVLDRVPLDFNRVVAEAAETCLPLVDARHHALEFKLAPGPLPMLADKPRLLQVCVNLISNAAKYTPEYGRIEIATVHEGDTLRLDVSDNGIGMTEEAMASVFGLFEQAAEGQSLAQGGLGIGLALVKQLVELHGGTVEVHCGGLGSGCCFTVRLPLTLPSPV